MRVAGWDAAMILLLLVGAWFVPPAPAAELDPVDPPPCVAWDCVGSASGRWLCKCTWRENDF
jgi:hypothetical protein